MHMDNSNLKKVKYLDPEEYERRISRLQKVAENPPVLSPAEDNEEQVPVNNNEEQTPAEDSDVPAPVDNSEGQTPPESREDIPTQDTTAEEEAYPIIVPIPAGVPSRNTPASQQSPVSGGPNWEVRPTPPPQPHIRENFPYPYPPVPRPNNTPPVTAQNKRKTSPITYILITISCVCLIGIAVLCTYYFKYFGPNSRNNAYPSYMYNQDGTVIYVPNATEGADSSAFSTDSISDTYIYVYTEDTVTEPATEPATEPITEPITEVPTQTVPSSGDSLAFLNELNQKYDNYFDFRPDETGNIIPDSSTRLISVQELYGMTEHEVCLARNEIYARHGYIFQTEKYNEYFSNFSWYIPRTRTLPTVNDIEDQNVKLMVAYEQSQGWD